MNVPNLFDPETRQRMGDLYGARPKPTRDAYEAQLKEWCELTDKRHTPAELAEIAADQARRVKVMEKG